LIVGEGDDGEAELAEEDGAVEDGGFADLGQGLFALEGFDGGDADVGVFGVGRVYRDDLGEAYGGFADGGVVDDELVALLHVAKGEQGLVVGDAVPGGFAVADEVVEGVFVRFSLEQVRHEVLNGMCGQAEEPQVPSTSSGQDLRLRCAQDDTKLELMVEKDSLAAEVDVVDVGQGLAEEAGAEALEFFYGVGGVERAGGGLGGAGWG
jgi:hypothetical protein